MTPNNQIAIRTSQASKDFQRAFEKWKAEPELGKEQILCDFFPDVLSYYEHPETWFYTGAFQHYVLKSLIEACHLMLDSNECFCDVSTEQIAAPLLKRGWWKRLVELEEDALLASLIIACTGRADRNDLTESAIEVASSWTDKTLAIDSTREDVARVLFGEAWVALYSEELDDSFETVFDVIAESTPVFFNATKDKQETSHTETLPSDLSL